MSRTEPEMEERNRLRERKATERRRDIPRSGGRFQITNAHGIWWALGFVAQTDGFLLVSCSQRVS